MSLRSAARAVGLAVIASLAGPLLAAAADNYDIHVILPMSGGGSFVGKGQQDSLETLAASVNKSGGIAGRPLHFVYHDDQTSPQVAVQLANEILGSHPTVVLGSSLVAMCRAIAPLMKDGPVHYCLSPGFHPAAGGFSFSSSSSSADQIAVTIRYFRDKGITKLAALQTTDASGQDGDQGIVAALKRPENSGVRLVAHEHFNPTDVSVSAQIERMKLSGAQALISWATGAPVATVFKGAIQGGLDIPVAPTSGNQTFAQMTQWADFLPKQLILPSALFPPHEGIVTLDPRIEKAQHEMYAAMRERGLKPDNMTATSWDAALIVVEGLRKLGPEASADALRQYIAALTDFPGVDGIYDFKENPERGLGPANSIVTRYDAKEKAFVWLSKPGGEPLAP
jgi:branched-chain amino acid transport system substrate-binding protein